MKTIIYLFLPLIGVSVQGQVGINTNSPKATLDVMKNTVDITKPDGIIAPRLKGSEVKSKDSLYNTDQKGTIVYVTEGLDIGNTTLKTAKMTLVGYYYFDGEVWQPFERDTLETVVKL